MARVVSQGVNEAIEAMTKLRAAYPNEAKQAVLTARKASRSSFRKGVRGVSNLKAGRLNKLTPYGRRPTNKIAIGSYFIVNRSIGLANFDKTRGTKKLGVRAEPIRGRPEQWKRAFRGVGKLSAGKFWQREVYAPGSPAKDRQRQADPGETLTGRTPVFRLHGPTLEAIMGKIPSVLANAETRGVEVLEREALTRLKRLGF